MSVIGNYDSELKEIICNKYDIRYKDIIKFRKYILKEMKLCEINLNRLCDANKSYVEECHTMYCNDVKEHEKRYMILDKFEKILFCLENTIEFDRFS